MQREESITFNVTYTAAWETDVRVVPTPRWIIEATCDSDGDRWFVPIAQTGQDDPVTVGVAALPESEDPEMVVRMWVSWYDNGANPDVTMFEEV